MQKDKIGKYRIESRAGAGAFGIVWKAISTEDEKPYAIKEISKSKMTKQLVENLIREVHISQKLEHCNLIKCFATMESKNNYYIVFEYCEGGDLGKYLTDTKKVKLADALSIMRQVREAYRYLFGENILHRDIKPDNILITERAKLEIKISDFGCSKVDPFGTTVCGTPKYMAIEVLEKQNQYNYKADLWSIGLCFWELVFGPTSFPFSLKSADALKADIKKFAGDQLRFPPTPKLEPVFYDFFRSILQSSPQQRMDAADFFDHPVFAVGADKEKEKEKELVAQVQQLTVGTAAEKRRGSVSKKGTSPAPAPRPVSAIKKSGVQEGKAAPPPKPSPNSPNSQTPIQNSHLIPNSNLSPNSSPALSKSGAAFADIRKDYSEKVLEVKLIKAVVQEMRGFVRNEWERKFAGQFKCLCLLILSKGIIKSENSFATLNERRNSYKLDNFEQFVQQPAEAAPLKEELRQLSDELKKMDDAVYGELIKSCGDAKLLEDINKNVYKNATAEAKKAFTADVYQFVKKHGAAIVEDCDRPFFEVQLKRSFIILKGDVLQKLDAFDC